LLIGVGTDSIEIVRVRAAIEKIGCSFVRRLFTEREEEYCEGKKDPYSSYAARFAGKEAVFKALGLGLGGCKWTDVEIINEAGGRPQVFLYGQAAQIAQEKKIAGVLISLSHDRERAVAFAAAVSAEAILMRE
jgi:holo-[acyl-carrier protein] synthase